MDRTLLSVCLTLYFFSVAVGQAPDWNNDFAYQPLGERPHLEVRYTDASREAYTIQANEYQLIGELQAPHRLLEDETGKVWLQIEAEDEQNTIYSTQFTVDASRINLYRRGPYYCEVHWLDLQLTSRDGRKLPVRGDLTLFAYPEKILAEISWHTIDKTPNLTINVKGIAPQTFRIPASAKGQVHRFSFPLFGEKPPLPNESFTLIEGATPLHYDYRRGCYLIGTKTSDSFQRQFYEFPNRYETATFKIRNDVHRRKIYICHESVEGGKIVEGGVVLNEEGHPLPLLVQISKNFDGEKEEAFYNPEDTPFSETFFPLYLEPGEELTLTSLHLYQNWGRKMTKHWSSLGAWMDYFHSSTGVTETTCYVPFKFGGLGGVAIADFRAMSQETFWSGQPQHDNLAGHSFLAFFDGRQWQHSVYRGTTYRSTGPNWFDIGMHYLSADSSIQVDVDVWETPQTDELRSFFKARYEVLKPLEVKNAQVDFRFLSVTSAVQRLRFSGFAASGAPERYIDTLGATFPVRGQVLPEEHAFLATYGDYQRKRGSNAIVISRFSGPGAVGPAASLQVGPYQQYHRFEKQPDTRLMLVPDKDDLSLKPGDVFEIEGFWLPYGPMDNADTPRREVETYSRKAPSLLSVTKGKKIADFPSTIEAEHNEAQFSLAGGRNLIPVIVTGLTDWRYPRIWQKENGQWRLLDHSRNTPLDGVQVFCIDRHTYGAVFLIGADENVQELRITAGRPVPKSPQLRIFPVSTLIEEPSGLTIESVDGPDKISFGFPVIGSGNRVEWQKSEGQSLWFEVEENGWNRGGRITPNEDEADLEYWWQNTKEGSQIESQEFWIDLSGSRFQKRKNRTLWLYHQGRWSKITVRKKERALKKGVRSFVLPGARASSKQNHSDIPEGILAVRSADGRSVLALGVQNVSAILNDDEGRIGLRVVPRNFPLSRRYHFRGKLFWLKGDLNIVSARWRRELGRN